MTNLVIFLILIISILTDLRNRKILNIVTLPAILVAFIYHFFTSGLDGLLFSGQGFLVGLGLLFIPFVMGGIGAGDVNTTCCRGGSRIVTVPIIETWESVNGRSDVIIIGFAAFWVEEVEPNGNDKAVIGRFIKLVRDGSFGPGEDFGIYGVKLVN